MTHSDQNGKSDLDLFSFCVILSLVCENSSEKMDTKNSKAWTRWYQTRQGNQF